MFRLPGQKLADRRAETGTQLESITNPSDGASAGSEVVENDLGLFLTRHQGKRQHGLLAPIQPEGSQRIGNRRRGHDLDPGSGPHSNSRRIIGRQTAEFLQDEVRNEHRHAGLIQLVQKAHAIEEDDRRRVDDALELTLDLRLEFLTLTWMASTPARPRARMKLRRSIPAICAPLP